MWHVTTDLWHVTRDMWHMVGGEHSLKFSAPQLLRFGIDIVSDKGVYRTAPATPGLLIIFGTVYKGFNDNSGKYFL